MPWDKNYLQRSVVCQIRTVLKFMYFIFVEIDLKKASKIFAQHFSCGSSVTGDDEVVVQGDVTDDIFDLIQKHWPEVGYCSFNNGTLCVGL